MNFYYHGAWRLDWGLGNPNRTAALIAMLMLAAWALAFFHRKGFWVSLGLFTGLGFCLIQTFSRGGLIACAVGGLTLLFWVPRPWPRVRMAAVAMALLILGIYAEFLSATGRYASSWQGDPSVMNRLELWKSVPRMLVDAPGGWGWGYSQEAYMLWYQPLSHTERFLNLVSLHFTLLAEWPWLGRFAYIFGWLAAFLLTFPGRQLRSLSVPFSILIAFFVAGISTHFVNVWIVYAVPLLALVAALFIRIKNRARPPALPFCYAAALALIITSGFYLLGRSESYTPVTGDVHRTVVGPGRPTVWILVDTTTLGAEYGRALRRYLQDHKNAPTLGFLTQTEPVPPCDTVVLAGPLTPSIAQSLKAAQPKHLILLNPPFFPAEITSLLPGTTLTPVFGEFSHSPSQSVWRSAGPVTNLEGAGDYLPQWPAAVLEALPHQ